MHQLGLPFRVVVSRVDEDGEKGLPADVTRSLAEKKACFVSQEQNGSWVLGADTVVVVNDTILGKPRDIRDAENMLALLSGNEHEVITGFCVLDPAGHAAHSETVSTRVKVKNLTDREIQGYIETREPFGKAGSYAIQGVGAFMIETISGSYTNVVGLPMCALVKALLSVGALRKFPL